jgi:iron complex outermembrane receptor protein
MTTRIRLLQAGRHARFRTPPGATRLLLALAAGFAGAAGAQTANDVVVITGSIRERAAAEAPYAITVIDRDALRSSGPMVNLSEALVQVPGLVVNNRNNYAQDLQISSRGFGARAPFGVRGLRLYSDGIPATMPDGQGQVAHFDLAGAQRIEVLRGPFSVLYGNSSGGVIALASAPVKAFTAEGGLDGGSFGLRQLRASVAAPLDGGWDLSVGASGLRIDGFRPHSEARRDLLNVRLGWTTGSDRLVLQAGAFRQDAQDPLGLTREQFLADPDQTAVQATDFDTRKEASQTQAGASWKHRFGEGALRESRVAVYGGSRSVTQWQAIPAAVQLASASHGGGVVDFDRDYSGIDARLVWGWEQAELVAGAAYETQTDDRRGYENFIGSGAARVLGVTGKLRRDETNSATSRDAYAQGEWTPTPDLTASAGIRSGRVRMSTRDAYLSNGNDSGALEYEYTNPVLGLRWKAAPGLQLHASAARGFESPTLAELAYRPSGGGGFNEGLKPQRSWQFELGAKWHAAAWDVDAALFRANTSDEIGVQTNSGGRSTYQNVGGTQRQGAELAAAWRIAPAWRAQWVASWLSAYYRDGFTLPGGTVAAGKRIIGTQRASSWAELVWRDALLGDWGLEWHAMSATPVSDLGSAEAPGYGVVNLRWVRSWALGGQTRLELLARIDNLADRRYVGSVIVNDANSRYYESAPPRAALLALRLIFGS